MVHRSTSGNEIALRPVTAENRAALQSLRVSPRQERFVSTVANAFAEAEEHPAAHPLTFGLYDGETPVGFVMIADEVDDPSYVPHFLWKLLIDERYQGQGYGTVAVDLVAEYFRTRGATSMWTSGGEGDGGPIPFYERYGFIREGGPHGDEVMLRLDLV